MSDDKEYKKEDGRETWYGWGAFKPRFLQWFNTLACFMTFIVLVYLTMGFASGWSGTSLEQLEKQFHLRSTVSATLGTANSLSSTCTIAFVSYIGKFNKAKALAFSVFLYGVGLALCSLPHYLLEPYKPPSQAMYSTERTPICPTNVSSPSNHSSVPAAQGEGHMVYFSILLVGQVLTGIGSSPIFTLGFAYIDNNASVTMAAILIGVLNTVGVIGAALSALVGGRIIQYLYVDFDRVDTDSLSFDSLDQRWVGAWWLGYIVTGIIILIMSLPISGFPKYFPNSPHREELEKNTHEQVNKNLYTYLKKSVTDFFKALFKLIFDLEFMLISVASAIEGVAVNGMAMFAFKFINHEYGLDYETTGYILGSKAIIGSVGYLLAGLLIKWFKLDLLGMERTVAGLLFVATVCGLTLFAACPDINMIGLDLPYPGDSDVSGFLAACQGQCQCQGQEFSPVCSSDGLVYFSPCHAGCLDSSMDGDVMTFSNCSCIAAGLNTSVTDALATATAGKCSTDCWQVYLVMPSLFVVYVTIITCATFSAFTTLRCVDQDLQAFALSIKMIFMAVIGSIPASVVVGVVVDSACELWSGSEGAQFCQLYDKQALAVGIAVMWLSVGLIACIFMFLASLVNLWKKKRRAEKKSTEMSDAGSRDEKHNEDAKSGVQESSP
ncbi:solute carrier organic anion transporter family member 4C1-like [Haliotis cracherodii]|uniref:solute carrier organic anion transporter family member 4C1-like n=1 Tax=Haliotis cracherodii TaxID=6455 RepID=UPI0039EBCF66